jgi:hypothetical protein
MTSHFEGDFGNYNNSIIMSKRGHAIHKFEVVYKLASENVLFGKQVMEYQNFICVYHLHSVLLT